MLIRAGSYVHASPGEAERGLGDRALPGAGLGVSRPGCEQAWEAHSSEETRRNGSMGRNDPKKKLKCRFPGGECMGRWFNFLELGAGTASE